MRRHHMLFSLGYALRLIEAVLMSQRAPTIKEDCMDSTSGDSQHEHEEFNAIGTLVFVLLMLLGYVVYWGYLWFIVVIERGGIS